MKVIRSINKEIYKLHRVFLLLAVYLFLFVGGCSLTKEPEVYYGRVAVPQKQEFRWSDGGLPKVFDPTFAVAPPDTDAVRAIFEGLTDYDPKTLKTVPAVAWRWESANDGREWTFHLRQTARWSNGDAVTAYDFVRSWQRVLNNKANSPHSKLLSNIVGVSEHKEKPQQTGAAPGPLQPPSPIYGTDQNEETADKQKEEKEKTQPLGIEAVDEYVLRVKLEQADQNFPALVAHPVFRPVYKNFVESNEPVPSDKIVTNGAFELVKSNQEGVVIEKARNYWDANTVNLERVLFVPTQNPESALAAYRGGDVDVVTNTRFEPLGLKLLMPYKDFYKATYGALVYYCFNTTKKPFDDVRVREALSIALDRERINEDSLGGASEPANSFLPPQSENKTNKKEFKLEDNIKRAQQLLVEAGFPQGYGFPKIKLLINRNDQQKQVAEAVAAMWKSALNVETEIIQKSFEEYVAALNTKDYDIARYNFVMQTMNETANMREMFAPIVTPGVEASSTSTPTPSPASSPNENGQTSNEKKNSEPETKKQNEAIVLTEAQALTEWPAIPIYFASSYSLIKPYVKGFDVNLLDAPSLKHVKIETQWKEIKPAAPSVSNIIQ